MWKFWDLQSIVCVIYMRPANYTESKSKFVSQKT